MTEKDDAYRLKMTIFRIRYGAYQFEVMPFGVATAPTFFQGRTYVAISRLLFVKVCVEDVLLSSKEIEEHLSHVREVSQPLKDRSLKIKLSKCRFI